MNQANNDRPDACFWQFVVFICVFILIALAAMILMPYIQQFLASL
jgi:hypothetical protein